MSGVGGPGDPAWAAAVIMHGRRLAEHAVLVGVATGAYVPGLLALRIGPLLSDAICRLPVRPDVVLIDATGRDHPRRAGLAVHLGAVLDLPSVGITHRPLLASGEWPDDLVNASAPLFLNGETVGYWLRTRTGRRPVAVHAGWRTDAETALRIVRACRGGKRTPAPLREARRLARRTRGGSAASDR
jgi:deoxyribonuclease V